MDNFLILGTLTIQQRDEESYTVSKRNQWGRSFLSMLQATRLTFELDMQYSLMAKEI